MTAPLVFVDCETTSLERPSSPTPGEIWEVAAVRVDPDRTQTERRWLLPVTLDHADPVSLDIGRFHDRHPQGDRHTAEVGSSFTVAHLFVEEFDVLADGCHWVGNVPSFDEERIAALFHAHGHTGRFPWHYHLIDVENLIAGHLVARGQRVHDSAVSDSDDAYAAELYDLAHPPWDSEDLSDAIGVHAGDFDRHTAMGDVRWAMAQYAAVIDHGAA